MADECPVAPFQPAARYDPDTDNGFAEHEMRAVTFLDEREPLRLTWQRLRPAAFLAERAAAAVLCSIALCLPSCCCLPPTTGGYGVGVLPCKLHPQDLLDRHPDLQMCCTAARLSTPVEGEHARDPQQHINSSAPPFRPALQMCCTTMWRARMPATYCTGGERGRHGSRPLLMRQRRGQRAHRCRWGTSCSRSARQRGELFSFQRPFLAALSAC